MHPKSKLHFIEYLYHRHWHMSGPNCIIFLLDVTTKRIRPLLFWSWFGHVEDQTAQEGCPITTQQDLNPNYPSKVIVLGGHWNRKTGANKSLSSNLHFDQSLRRYEPKTENTPFANAFPAISWKRQTIHQILLAPPSPTWLFCIQRASHKSNSSTPLSRKSTNQDARIRFRRYLGNRSS